MPENNVGNEQRKLDAIINSIADAVISLNAELRIEKFNASALSILNLNKIEK
jgi:sensor histidine kinase regulating citrate/malate metabolism